MKITIVSVGKKPKGSELEMIEEYTKRIQKPWEIAWNVLPHQPGNATSAKKAESSAILEVIKGYEVVLLLDERGDSIDNQKLAHIFDSGNVQNLAVIIGGAYGVDERVREQSDKIIKLSDLVLPHRLVRILLVEQLYRSQMILLGHPYHHG